VSARRIGIAVAAAASLVAAAPAGAAAPVVNQMVVFKDGSAKVKSVRASSTRVRIGSKRCAVGAGTPLAALVRSKPGTLRYKDFGSCSSRARDAGGLYVRGIGRDVISGPEDPDGWVYKVGNRAAPAGAGDPSGPFGRGLLRSGQRVTWFWCVSLQGEEGCQRTLELKPFAAANTLVSVRVRGYDNAGKGVPVEGATIEGGDEPATTGPDGTAQVFASEGTYRFVARKDGMVRSYPVRYRAP
jgi:hypothetical protein